MKYYIFLDDSGQLHPNYPVGDYFVYGGLLVKDSDYHGIHASYTKFVQNIKKEQGITEELKTTRMDIPTRRRLLNRLSKYSCEQIFVSVKVSALQRIDFRSKKDVVRYKNYIIKRLIEELIITCKIPQNCTFIELQIDHQNIAHSAQDSLQDYLFNIFNEDNHYRIYQKYDPTSFVCDFRVLYRDSRIHYLIQAADLLANSMFKISSENKDISGLLKSGYTHLKLPDGMND